MLQHGDWDAIRKLRKPRQAKCRKLRNAAGDLVESSQWADTMANHLEEVQWRVRLAGLVDGPQLGPDLAVAEGDFTKAEVKLVLQQLKTKRASGPDEIPAEFWKAVGSTESGLNWITDLCNHCWQEESLPEDWHHANVHAIHKKGPIELC